MIDRPNEHWVGACAPLHTHNSSPVETRLKAAEEAKTLLGRERAIRGDDLARASKISGIHQLRLSMMESGTLKKMYADEKIALERYCAMPVELALLPNTVENRVKLAGRF